MAANLFERLAKGRPPPTPKFGNSELAHDLQILHEWLQRRDEPIVCLRDICHHGPRGMRDRKRAIDLTEILTGHGWLVPERAHRYDRRVWQIIRAHGGYPTIATMTTAARLAATR